MDKFRLKVDRHEPEAQKELSKILKKTVRNYSHMRISHFFASCLPEVFKNFHWKTLTLSEFYFKSASSAVSLLQFCAEDLEEIEFKYVYDAGLLLDSLNYCDLSKLRFHKLRVIRSNDRLPFQFLCTTLNVLDHPFDYYGQTLELLKTNPKMEDLRFPHEGLDLIFQQDFSEIGINLKLRNLEIIRNKNRNVISSKSMKNFEAFMRTQSECLQRAYFELLFDKRRVKRTAGGREVVIRNLDACVNALNIIFRDFKNLEVLCVTKSHLSRTNCPLASELDIVPNANIRKFRFLSCESIPIREISRQLREACTGLKNRH